MNARDWQWWKWGMEMKFMKVIVIWKGINQPKEKAK
jgi:hypothetical protein